MILYENCNQITACTRTLAYENNFRVVDEVRVGTNGDVDKNGLFSYFYELRVKIWAWNAHRYSLQGFLKDSCDTFDMKSRLKQKKF